MTERKRVVPRRTADLIPLPLRPKLPERTTYLFNDVNAAFEEEERQRKEAIGGSGYLIEDLNRQEMVRLADELGLFMSMEFYALAAPKPPDLHSNGRERLQKRRQETLSMVEMLQKAGVPEPLDLALYLSVTGPQRR